MGIREKEEHPYVYIEAPVSCQTRDTSELRNGVGIMLSSCGKISRGSDSIDRTEH